MSEPRRMRVMTEQHRIPVLYIDIDNITAQDGEYKMTAKDTVVRCTCNTASGSYTLYLPSVVEAVGKIYAIHGTVANSKTILVMHLGDSDDWDGGSNGYAINADNDGVLLYSDGITWWDMENRGATAS